uniref:Uncharacterized protein n=1 Tax=Serinus canaria TaxID=9135 RepID=A0A8C9MQQ3_SERCA
MTLTERLRQRISGAFYSHGLLCASYPIPIILFTSPCACVSPLLKLPLPGTGPVEFSTPLKDYAPPGGQGLQHGEHGERPDWRDIPIPGGGDWPGERAGAHQVRGVHARGPGGETAHRPRWELVHHEEHGHGAGDHPHRVLHPGPGHPGVLPLCRGGAGVRLLPADVLLHHRAVHRHPPHGGGQGARPGGGGGHSPATPP